MLYYLENVNKWMKKYLDFSIIAEKDIYFLFVADAILFFFFGVVLPLCWVMILVFI